MKLKWSEDIIGVLRIETISWGIYDNENLVNRFFEERENSTRVVGNKRATLKKNHIELPINNSVEVAIINESVLITVDSSHSFSSPLCFITKFLLNEVKCKRKVPKYIENFVKYVNEHIGIYEHNNNKDDVFPPWFEDYVKSAIEQDKHDDKNKLMNP